MRTKLSQISCPKMWLWKRKSTNWHWTDSEGAERPFGLKLASFFSRQVTHVYVCTFRYCQAYDKQLTQQEFWTQLEHLAELVHSGQPKEVKILQASGRCSQIVVGASWLSCKSGKDRTGMMCTLEAVELCCRHQGEVVQAEVVEELRLGLRLTNCMINTGKRAYAFNAIQIQALSKELRPPKGAYGEGVQS